MKASKREEEENKVNFSLLSAVPKALDAIHGVDQSKTR